MKADRITKLKRFDQYRQGGAYDFMLPANYGPWVKHDDAVKLVKAERATVRRIIKQQRRIYLAKQADGKMRYDGGAEAYWAHKVIAMDDLLATLNRRST